MTEPHSIETPVYARSSGIDPVAGRFVTGWAAPGAKIELRLEGEDKALASSTTTIRRQFVLRRPFDDACGFSIALPDGFAEGGARTVRVTDEAGADLPGSPITVSGARHGGAVDAVRGNVIFGHILCGPEDDGREIVVSAVAGDETVAIAVAQKSGSRRPFAIGVPSSVLAAGHRIVYVAARGDAGWLENCPVVMPRLEGAKRRIAERRRPVTLAVKISAPNMRVAHEWGDYHFARQLGAALQRRGWVVRVDCQDDWSRTGDDAALVLRGRHRHTVDRAAVNMMWQISHPDRMSDAETQDFDHIFVASDIYAKLLGRRVETPVTVLHQATDPSVFYPPESASAGTDRPLFVGNSRKEYRRLVKWSVENGVDIAIYGSLWDGIIPERYIRGVHIENADLYRWYGGCPVLLNDHWDTMRDFGFLSNRLFDGSAAGAFIISDKVRGLSEVFGDSIETVETSEELKNKLAHYMAQPEQRLKKAAEARSRVLTAHTFDHRAETIIKTYESIATWRATVRAG